MNGNLLVTEWNNKTGSLLEIQSFHLVPLARSKYHPENIRPNTFSSRAGRGQDDIAVGLGFSSWKSLTPSIVHTERNSKCCCFVSVSRNYSPICVSLYSDEKFAEEEHLRNCVFTTNAIYPLCELKFSPASTKKKARGMKLWHFPMKTVKRRLKNHCLVPAQMWQDINPHILTNCPWAPELQSYYHWATDRRAGEQ